MQASIARAQEDTESVLSGTFVTGVVLFRPTGAHLCGEPKNTKRRPISCSPRKSTVPPVLWTQLSQPTAVIRGRPSARQARETGVDENGRVPRLISFSLWYTVMAVAYRVGYRQACIRSVGPGSQQSLVYRVSYDAHSAPARGEARQQLSLNRQ